jgi:hypothetical protein
VLGSLGRGTAAATGVMLVADVWLCGGLGIMGPGCACAAHGGQRCRGVGWVRARASHAAQWPMHVAPLTLHTKRACMIASSIDVAQPDLRALMRVYMPGVHNRANHHLHAIS